VQQAQAGVDQAQQQLAKARLPYTAFDLQQQAHAVAQAQALLDKASNPYTEQDLAAAQAAVDQARAQLDLAQLGVRETTVAAPVDGVISERLVSPGSMVSQATPIVTLVPPALELVVNVEESQLGQVAEGQSVQLEVPAFPKQTFTGAVKSIAPTVDAKSRTAAVRIEPKDDGSKLRAGMFARLNIITAQKQNTLIVPKEALLSTSQGADPLVIAIGDGGQVHRTPVRIGLQNERFVEILGGLNEGQMVATSSLNDLNDGDIVAPQVENRTALAR
jgi:RND family efflux transporter MFP subunit